MLTKEWRQEIVDVRAAGASALRHLAEAASVWSARGCEIAAGIAALNNECDRLARSGIRVKTPASTLESRRIEFLSQAVDFFNSSAALTTSQVNLLASTLRRAVNVVSVLDGEITSRERKDAEQSRVAE